MNRSPNLVRYRLTQSASTMSNGIYVFQFSFPRNATSPQSCGWLPSLSTSSQYGYYTATSPSPGWQEGSTNSEISVYTPTLSSDPEGTSITKGWSNGQNFNSMLVSYYS
jgi:hypothetical protein